MNKHTIITIIAIIIIILPFAYSGLNIYGIEQMQYRWNEPGNFRFFDMSTDGKIEFCNTMPYFIYFQSFEIITFFDGEEQGTLSVEPLTVDPSSYTSKMGIFSSDKIVEAQHRFMQLDYTFDGGVMRLDPNKLSVIVNIDTPIMGIIPYSTTIQNSGFDFDILMNEENFRC